MANQYTVYKSTDTSAPVLHGNAGDLVALLDACLVGTAGVAYGSKSAAGWAIAFTGTNKRVYRAPSGARLYYRVQDDALGTGGAKEALVKGAESFSDVDTPTNPFPTAAQITLTSNSLVIRKSATADNTTARAWVVLADARTCYINILSGDIANAYMSAAFGEFFSLVSADSFNGFVSGRITENSAVANNGDLDELAANIASGTSGFYLCRNYLGATGAAIGTRFADHALQSANDIIGLGQLVAPNPPDGLYYANPVRVGEATPVVRGRMRGLWSQAHAISNWGDGDTPSGNGDLTGKTFLACKSTPHSGIVLYETSATLETN